MATGQELVDEVARLLRDESKRQWSQPRLIAALNSAYQALCTLKPDANTLTQDITLVEGTLQKVPDDVHAIVEALYNICPVTGEVRRVITKADRSALDAAYPHWHNDSPRGYVKQWMPSLTNEHIFHVWPQAEMGYLIRMLVAKVPVVDDIGVRPVVPPLPVDPNTVGPVQAKYEADLAAYDQAVTDLAAYNAIAAARNDLSDEVPVDVIYEPFLREWMLYYAYQVDDEMTANASRAQGHFTKAFDLLGLRARSQMALNDIQITEE